MLISWGPEAAKCTNFNSLKIPQCTSITREAGPDGALSCPHGQLLGWKWCSRVAWCSGSWNGKGILWTFSIIPNQLIVKYVFREAGQFARSGFNGPHPEVQNWQFLKFDLFFLYQPFSCSVIKQLRINVCCISQFQFRFNFWTDAMPPECFGIMKRSWSSD